MSVYEPNSRHLREVLIFCFNMKKSEAHRMLSNTYGEAAISERTCRESFQCFKNGDFDVEDRHSGGREKVFEDAEGWRHYLSKTRIKIKKNWHDHWEWLNKPFQNASKPWEWFRSKEIGCRTNWSREMLNGVCLWIATWKKRFLHRIVTGDEKWVTIIPSVKNHE